MRFKLQGAFSRLQDSVVVLIPLAGRRRGGLAGATVALSLLLDQKRRACTRYARFFGNQYTFVEICRCYCYMCYVLSCYILLAPLSSSCSRYPATTIAQRTLRSILSLSNDPEEIPPRLLAHRPVQVAVHVLLSPAEASLHPRDRLRVPLGLGHLVLGGGCDELLTLLRVF